MMRKILFLTGTRADFGKLRALMDICQEDFEVHIFVTGMHMLSLYGSTWTEVKKRGYENIHTFINQNTSDTQDIILSKTIQGLSDCVKEIKPDMIVVHGDRVEALAGAITGMMNGITVAHIEGGEVSGSIDEPIRHAVSKLSHMHFVSNDRARARLRKMGERNIYTIGSPDVDVMMSDLPPLEEVKDWYGIRYDEYYILLFHPVVGENMGWQIKEIVNELEGENVVAIYPNNDPGYQDIINEINRLPTVFPSIRFECFLTLLKNARAIIGNSSSGLMEAPYYGVPAVNVGSRQRDRAALSGAINCCATYVADAIKSASVMKVNPSRPFGDHGCAEKFLRVIRGQWPDQQKVFHETDRASRH